MAGNKVTVLCIIIMILGKSLIDIAACVRVCTCMCVCAFVGGEGLHITHCLVCELE